MTDHSSIIHPKYLSGQQNAPSDRIHKDREPSVVFNENFPSSSSSTHKSESLINNDTAKGSTNIMSSDEAIATSTRDTIVVLVTLSIIFFTLVATYFLWRKHRTNFANLLYK